MSFLGTPDTIYHKQPDTSPTQKAEPVATEKTLHGIRNGLSMINSDLTSITHKLGEKGLIYQVLEEIADILNRSSIARHSESPLEQSLNAIKEQTVYYNEKTMKWHDAQSKRFAPKQKELDTAAIQIRKGDNAEDTMEAKAEITPEDNYLKQIAENTKALLEKDFGGGGGESAEDRMESEARAENRARDTKAYRKTIKGRWNTFLKWGKDSFLGKNWKLILAGLLLLFTPFKVLKPLWDMVKVAWNFSKEHPIIAAVLGIGTAIALALLGPLAVLLAPLKLLLGIGKGLRGVWRFLRKPKVPRTGTTRAAGRGTPARQARADRLKGMTKAERHAERAAAKKTAETATKTATKTAAKKTAETATKTAAKKTAETAAKKTATKAGAKAGAKALGKSVLKKIPIIGLFAGGAFAVQRAMAGDFTGAGMEIASGAMSLVPFAGTAGSIGMDAALMARDMGAFEDKEKEGKELGKTLDEEYKAGKKDGQKATVLNEDAKKQAEVEKKKTKATKMTKGGWTPEQAIERKKKKSDDYVAAQDEGVNVEGEADSGFEGLSKKDQTKLFEFAKKRGVSEEQVRGGYFNYSTLLDRGSISKHDIGYGGAEERARLRTGMDYKERRKAFKDEHSTLSDKWKAFWAPKINIDWKDPLGWSKPDTPDTDKQPAAVKTPPRSTFKTKIPAATGLMPNEEGWDDDDDDLIKQDDAARKKLGKPFGKIKYQTGVDVGTKEEKVQKNIIKYVQLKEERFKKAKRDWVKRKIAKKVAAQLRGPHRELLLEALKGTKLEERIKKQAGGLKGPANLSKVKGAEKMLTSSGGLDMQSKAFSSHMGARSAEKPAEEFVPTTTEEAEKLADFPNDPSDVEDTRQVMDMEKKARIAEASKLAHEAMAKGTFVANKLVPKETPAAKMDAMNQVHTDKATLGGTPQASPVIISNETTNSSVQSNPLTYVGGASNVRGKTTKTGFSSR